MKDPIFLRIVLVPLLLILFLLVRVLLPRLRMARRAKDLLAKMPQHELRTAGCWPSPQGGFPTGKKKWPQKSVKKKGRDGRF